MGPTKQNILIVDDEEVIRTICSRSLSERRYHTVFAENGAEALGRLRERTFKIVFTDLKMPIMDGVELLDAVKRDYPGTEVIVMTAFATLQEAVEAMKKGAYDFILKPIKPDQIRFAAEKCLAKIELGEENRVLRLANRKLNELQNMKDKFIAITSHELRTPVSHLKGYLDILLSRDLSYQLSDEEKEQCVKVIFDAVHDLEEIVTKMHDLVHLQNGKLKVSSEQIEVNSLVQNIVEEYSLLGKKRKQEIEFVKGTSALNILADREQIKDAISELIQNAIKFTPDGGTVQVETKSDGAFCIISVKDTGVGIDLSEHGKIFEKFYEVQDSKYHTSSKAGFMGGGLGLGLPSAEAIAAAHGGGIKVVSERDQGSEFLFYLPLAQRDYPLN